jgi:hypothetical protein
MQYFLIRWQSNSKTVCVNRITDRTVSIQLQWGILDPYHFTYVQKSLWPQKNRDCRRWSPIPSCDSPSKYLHSRSPCSTQVSKSCKRHEMLRNKWTTCRVTCQPPFQQVLSLIPQVKQLDRKINHWSLRSAKVKNALCSYYTRTTSLLRVWIWNRMSERTSRISVDSYGK